MTSDFVGSTIFFNLRSESLINRVGVVFLTRKLLTLPILLFFKVLLSCNFAALNLRYNLNFSRLNFLLTNYVSYAVKASANSVNIKLTEKFLFFGETGRSS